MRPSEASRRRNRTDLPVRQAVRIRLDPRNGARKTCRGRHPGMPACRSSSVTGLPCHSVGPTHSIRVLNSPTSARELAPGCHLLLSLMASPADTFGVRLGSLPDMQRAGSNGSRVDAEPLPGKRCACVLDENLNDLSCSLSGPIGSRRVRAGCFLEMVWICRRSPRVARACCGSRN